MHAMPCNDACNAGANPTHQVHVHFFWIWLWLARVARLAARQVELLADCSDPDACMGKYGRGLASALLSDPIFLPLEPQPIIIDRVKFGLGGNWPFPLWEHRPVRPMATRASSNLRNLFVQTCCLSLDCYL